MVSFESYETITCKVVHTVTPVCDTPHGSTCYTVPDFSRLPPTDFTPECLQPPTSELLSNICQGLPGTHFTFDEYCSIMYGNTSVRGEELEKVCSF